MLCKGFYYFLPVDINVGVIFLCNVPSDWFSLYETPKYENSRWLNSIIDFLAFQNKKKCQKEKCLPEYHTHARARAHTHTHTHTHTHIYIYIYIYIYIFQISLIDTITLKTPGVSLFNSKNSFYEINSHFDDTRPIVSISFSLCICVFICILYIHMYINTMCV